MTVFKEQVSTGIFTSDIFYVLAVIMTVMVILGLGLIDASVVRRKNLLDTWVQKIVGAICGGIGITLIGYPLWVWQYNQAFGTPQPLGEAFKDWWLGGHFLTNFAQFFDPKVAPEQDVFQVFFAFFIVFGMVAPALLHGGVLERMKPLPFFITSFLFGAIVEPVLSYLCWGSTSPLTNHGLHDYPGIMSVYIPVGVISLILAWRLGPRLGYSRPHPSGAAPIAHNVSLAAIGALLLIFALPFVLLGAGFLTPGEGYFGISFTTSGIGIVISNLFMAFLGGGLCGAVMAYVRREAIWVILGPIAGYLMTATMIDIGMPWYVGLVAIAGPPLALLGSKVVQRLGVDDPKVAPLVLGVAPIGVIVTGIVMWGTKTGGYPGLEGKYGFQHAEITPWTQALGVAVSIGFAAIFGLVLAFFLEWATGLRVSEEAEVVGLDQYYWSTDNFGREVLASEHIPDPEEPTVGAV